MAREGLNRRKVTEAAAQIADGEGLRSVTLARVAQQLEVKSPSLYKHVESLDALHREIASLGLQELTGAITRAALGRARDDAIRAICDAYRDFARVRPGLYAATIRAPDASDPELHAVAGQLVAVLLAVLEGYGLRGDDALHAVRGLRARAHGFVSLEAAGGFGMPLEVDESWRRLVEGLVGDLRSASKG